MSSILNVAAAPRLYDQRGKASFPGRLPPALDGEPPRLDGPRHAPPRGHRPPEQCDALVVVVSEETGTT